MAAHFERFWGRENKAGTLSSVTRHNCSTHHAKLPSLLNAFCTASHSNKSVTDGVRFPVALFQGTSEQPHPASVPFSFTAPGKL